MRRMASPFDCMIKSMVKKQREKKKRSKPLLEDTAATSDSGLARALGSTDRDTREKGLLVLTQWLNSHPDASQNEIIRLWKALYYCFWHSDLVSVQVGYMCHACPENGSASILFTGLLDFNELMAVLCIYVDGISGSFEWSGDYLVANRGLCVLFCLCCDDETRMAGYRSTSHGQVYDAG